MFELSSMLRTRVLELLPVMLPLLDEDFWELTSGELLRDRFDSGIGEKRLTMTSVVSLAEDCRLESEPRIYFGAS